LSAIMSGARAKAKTPAGWVSRRQEKAGEWERQGAEHCGCACNAACGR
jgi:hypothetical protein